VVAAAEGVAGWSRSLRKRLRLLGGRSSASLLVVAGVLGAGSGLVSSGFWEAIAALAAAFSYYVVSPLDRALPLPVRGASWGFLLPAAGGVLVGVLAYRLFRTPQRLGVAAVMLDTRTRWGRIPFRYVPATFVNAAITIASGGSAGREAPVVVMGGGLGAWLGRTLNLAPARRQLLVAAGGAAAIAAAFNAPLAGVFFTLEVILGDWRTSTLAPVMLAAVAGTAVCRATEGSAEAGHFQVPPYQLASWWEPVVYAGLGVLAGALARLFVGAVEEASRRFDQLGGPIWLRPGLGGLAVGLLGLAVPGVLGNGYPVALAGSSDALGWPTLAITAVGKIVATALTLGSGGGGGDFAPLLVVGSMAGGLYGKAVALLLGHGVASSGAYAMVGMGAVLAGAARCPITAVLLLFELTGSYQVILPIMVAVATATMVARRLSPFGMYHRQVRDLGGPAFEVRGAPALEGVTVGDVMGPVQHTLPASATLPEVLAVLRISRQWVVPVLRPEGSLLGVVRLADVRPFLAELGDSIPVVAEDLAVEDVPLVVRDTPLATAARLLGEGEWEELPVLASSEDRRPVGLLSRRQVVLAQVEAD